MHVVGVMTDHGEEWHITAPAGPDYSTLCGVDADDPAIGHYGTIKHTPRGQRVTCQQCRSTYEHVKSLRGVKFD